MESITYMSASAIQRKIMAKEISPIEVMDHFINRIEKRNASINALVDVDFEGARAQAKEAERTLMAGYHIPFPGAVHLEQDGDGFRAVPVFWRPVL